MQEKLGETFEGTLRSAMRLGLFVVLDDLMVSGLVPIRDLSDDYYEVDPLRFALVGKHSGRAFKPGDRVTVTVARVDIEQGELDLHFAQ
jgi:ribonuclease R